MSLANNMPDEIEKMVAETEAQKNAKEFLAAYNKLVKKHGLALNPTIKLGFEVIKAEPKE